MFCLWDVSSYLLLFVNEYNTTKSSSLSLLDLFILGSEKPVSHQGTGGKYIFEQLISTLVSERWHLTDHLSPGTNTWTFGTLLGGEKGHVPDVPNVKDVQYAGVLNVKISQQSMNSLYSISQVI